MGLETQVPYHNKRIWESFCDFVVDYGPHEIIGIGDHLDCPAPSRWNRGTAEEYAGNLQQEIDIMKGLFTDVRNLFGGPFSIHEGNHEARINSYARTKAPAFADLNCLEVPSLLDYKGFDIRERNPIEELAKGSGWLTTHGDCGGSSLYSGGTALGLARRWSRSVVCGHTHRLGILNESHGVGANKILTGAESGHMMDVKKASYIKNEAPNWQSGWLAIEVKGAKVHVSTVNVAQNGVITFHE